MKFFRVTFITLLLSAVITVVFAQTRTTKPAATPAPVLKLTSPNDSLQYTLGAYLGQWVTTNGFAVNNADLFLKGMNDALTNKNMLIPAATVAAKLDSYQKRLISAKGSQQERLLFENVKKQSGVGMLPSGVAYAIMKAGNGLRPLSTDSVLVHVKGFLPDGQIFEDTYAKKNPIRITPSGLIPGMNEALQIMPAGSTWRLFIPSALGYAERGVPGLVPAYSALIFEVELIEVAK